MASTRRTYRDSCAHHPCTTSMVGTGRAKCSVHWGVCSEPTCGKSSIRKGDRKGRDRTYCSMHEYRARNGMDMEAPSQKEVEWFINRDGYMVSQKRQDRLGKTIRYQHREVMETVLGRNLLPGENVHHKNGVKHDNRPENLELWVTVQPSGQRPEDLLEWADEIYRRYK